MEVLGSQRSEVEFAFEGKVEEVVLEVEPLLLLTIVWKNIFSVAETVVETAIFFYRAVDAVSYACCRPYSRISSYSLLTQLEELDSPTLAESHQAQSPQSRKLQRRCPSYVTLALR